MSNILISNIVSCLALICFSFQLYGNESIYDSENAFEVTFPGEPLSFSLEKSFCFSEVLSDLGIEWHHIQSHQHLFPLMTNVKISGYTYALEKSLILGVAALHVDSPIDISNIFDNEFVFNKIYGAFEKKLKEELHRSLVLTKEVGSLDEVPTLNFTIVGYEKQKKLTLKGTLLSQANRYLLAFSIYSNPQYQDVVEDFLGSFKLSEKKHSIFSLKSLIPH